jgi:hypothetical protein
MKQLLQKLAFLLLLVSAVTLTSRAQAPEKGKASISEGNLITLDITEPLVAEYTFSYATMVFKNDAAAERYFMLCRDNLVTYTVDLTKKEATVQLRLSSTDPRGWGVAEYNAYFAKVAERYQQMQAVVNE